MDGINTYSVFAIEDGVVKIVNAKISQAQIDNLLVGTSNIEPGAITQATVTDGGGHGPTSAGAYNTFDIVVNHGLGSPSVKVELSLVHNYPPPNTVAWYLQNVTDGGNLDSGTNDPIRVFTSVLFNPPAGRASTTFRVGTSIFGSGTAFTRRQFLAYTFKR